MLRHAIQSSFYKRSQLLHRCAISSGGSHHSPPLLPAAATAFNVGQNRCFFFGSSGSDDDDSKKGGDKDKKDEPNDKKDDEDSKSSDEQEQPDKEPSATLNNSSRYNRTSPRHGGGNPNVLLPASRLGFGDQAPRYPHLMALPVIRGPVFPGVLTPVTVTDKVRLPNSSVLL
jgi:hypothetical protein